MTSIFCCCCSFFLCTCGYHNSGCRSLPFGPCVAYPDLRCCILELENCESASQSLWVYFAIIGLWPWHHIIWDFRSNSRHDFPEVHSIIGEKRQHSRKPWVADCAGWLAKALFFPEEILLTLEGSMQKTVEKKMEPAYSWVAGTLYLLCSCRCLIKWYLYQRRNTEPSGQWHKLCSWNAWV